MPTLRSQKIWKSVRVIYSLCVLLGACFVLAASVPNFTSRDPGIEGFLAMQVSLVLAVAWLAARAWAHPAVFLAFGSVTTAFILVPWSLFSKSLHGMSFFDELINLILLLATVIGIGLLCRLIAQGHIQRSGH